MKGREITPRKFWLVAALVVTACSPTRETRDAQEAAIAFLARQAHPPRRTCVQVATKPGELVEGMVQRDLEDPRPDVIERLTKRGIRIEGFATCDGGKEAVVVLRVGWPSAIDDGLEVPVDRLCGPLGCDAGYLVHVIRTSDGWQAVGARSTWISDAMRGSTAARI